MDKTQTINVAYDRVSLLLLFFLHVNVSVPMTMRCQCICSYDHEIMQLPDTGGIPCVYQTLQCYRVTIKVLYRYLQRCFLGWHGSRLGFVTPCDGEVSRGPLGNTTSQQALQAM